MLGINATWIPLFNLVALGLILTYKRTHCTGVQQIGLKVLLGLNAAAFFLLVAQPDFVLPIFIFLGTATMILVPIFLMSQEKERSSISTTDDQENVREMVYNKLSSMAEMAAGIAHEINNPLTIIAGNAIKIKREMEKSKTNTARVVESAEKIEKTVDRIVKIIVGLRSFSKDSVGAPLEKTPVEKLIQDALLYCQQRLKENGVMIRKAAVPGSPQIDCHPVQLSQVIINLINNAFDSVVSCDQKWIEIEVKEEAESVYISISDSGPGIPPHLRERIFAPFFTTKGPDRGTGLGLSLCKGIIEMHKGTLTLSETLPTKFIINVPKKQKLLKQESEAA